MNKRYAYPSFQIDSYNKIPHDRKLAMRNFAVLGHVLNHSFITRFISKFS